MSDWADTVKDRENGEAVGYIGHDEPVDNGKRYVAADNEPIEDIRRDAVGQAEAANADVVDVPQPPAAKSDPAPAPTNDPGKYGVGDNSGANANPSEQPGGQTSAGPVDGGNSVPTHQGEHNHNQ